MNAVDAVASATALAASSTLAAVRGARLSILIFHRVLASKDVLFPSELDQERFSRLMQVVASAYRVMSLNDAVARLRDGSLPARALVITFDDGYADNEQLALPILRRYGLPATFFVSTGFLDGGRMWNDTVIECMRRCRRDTIDLAALELGRVSLADASQRRKAIDLALPKIKYMDLAARKIALTNLLLEAGNPPLPNDLMMSTAQVRSLRGAGMEIGAHTVNHPILTTIADSVARQEMAQGKSDLESIIDVPVRYLAYPNGMPDRDYDSGHVRLAKNLGFEAAVTTAAGVSRTGDDLFQLPRYTPWHRSIPRWMLELVSMQARRHFAVTTAMPEIRTHIQG